MKDMKDFNLKGLHFGAVPFLFVQNPKIRYETSRLSRFLFSAIDSYIWKRKSVKTRLNASAIFPSKHSAGLYRTISGQSKIKKRSLFRNSSLV